MILKNISFLMLTLIFTLSATAQKNMEQLLDSFYSKQNRPLIILNYTSSDCVNCRLGVSSMLPALADKIGSNHIEILTDHKNQLRYLNKFPEIFGKYKVQVSKELSEGLSKDGSSKIYVAGKDKMIAYNLNNSSDSLVNDIVEKYNRLRSEGSKAVLKKRYEHSSIDSVFEPMETMFESSNNTAVLFSRKFQVGKQCDLKSGVNKDFEFTLNANAVKRLNKLLAAHDPRTYVSADSAIKVLNTVTLPMVYVENLRIAAGKCYIAFKYNSVTIDGGPVNDPDIGIRPRYFVGMLDIDKPGINVSDLSRCEDFYLIDTARVGNEVYKTSFWSVIDAKHGMLAIRAQTAQQHDLKVQHSDTTLYVASFPVKAVGIPKPDAIYHFNKDNLNDELIFRYCDKGRPIVWNQLTVHFAGDLKHTILSTKECDDAGLTYVYDFLVEGNEMYVLGVLQWRRVVLLKLNLTSKQISLLADISDNSLSGAFRFTGKNSFAGYTKDLNNNKLYTISCNYSMAKPEMP